MRLQTRELPVGGAGLALLVDREADHRRAVLPREREHPVEARARPLAVLEVGRVEERLAAGVLEAGLEDLGLGGVEHEGERCLRREATGELVHVGDTVATDVVDAHVEDVRALLHLLARHLHARVPVGFEHRVTELPRSVRVRALTDQRGSTCPDGTGRACTWTSSPARAPVCARAERDLRRCGRRPPAGARVSCRSIRRRC